MVLECFSPDSCLMTEWHSIFEPLIADKFPFSGPGGSHCHVAPVTQPSFRDDLWSSALHHHRASSLGLAAKLDRGRSERLAPGQLRHAMGVAGTSLQAACCPVSVTSAQSLPQPMADSAPAAMWCSLEAAARPARREKRSSATLSNSAPRKRSGDRHSGRHGQIPPEGCARFPQDPRGQGREPASREGDPPSACPE